MTESPQIKGMRAKKAFTDQFIISFVAAQMLNDYQSYCQYSAPHIAVGMVQPSFALATSLAENAWQKATMFHVEFGEVTIKDLK